MTRDLFGRVTFGKSKATQPALFGDLHWFTLGYLDCWAGAFQVEAESAYRLGWEAAIRDRQVDDRDSNCDAGRAFRQAKAVGNVQE